MMKDTAGNSTTITLVAKIDTESPTVDFGTNGRETAGKTASTTVTVSDSKSGVKTSSLKYLWTVKSSGVVQANFVGNNAGTFTNGGTVSLPSGNAGEYYLWVYAEDNVGNAVITKTNKFVVGNVQPEADISLSTTNQTNQNVTITIKPYAPTVLYDDPYFATTARDNTKAGLPTASYAGKKFRVSGTVHTVETADSSKTTSAGFYYYASNSVRTWVAAYTITTGNATTATNFNTVYTIPSNYDNSLAPWFQINVTAGTPGYRVEYSNIKYEYFDYTKISSVTVNGTAVTLTDGVGTYNAPANGTYNIVVTDIYGNSRTFTQTISNIDKTQPTVSISGGTSQKTGTQSLTLKATDGVGVTAYY